MKGREKVLQNVSEIIIAKGSKGGEGVSTLVDRRSKRRMEMGKT